MNLYHLYHRYLSNVIKISAKINTMQNINILLFVCSLSLTSLYLWSYARQVYRPSSVNTVKIWRDGQKPHKTKKTWKIANFFKFVHKKVFKMSSICMDTCLKMLSSLSTAVSIMSGQKSDHRPTLLNCEALSLLRTVNEWMNKKKNVDILHIFNLCTYFMTFDRYLLDRW